MIEVNLVPDVKQELINAKRVRALVITGAVFVGLAAIGVVVILAVYLFGVQTLRSTVADSAITSKSNDLKNVPDLAKMLTIQHQLTVLSQLHDQKNIDSRFFDLLAAINPQAPNQVTFSLARVDANTKLIRLEGQAVNGYAAAEALKKTILNTSISYKDNGEQKTTPLTSNVAASELSYGEDATGKKVLRFTLTFQYADAYFARSSQDAVTVRPDLQNATDSYLQVPITLFGDRATDQKGVN